MSIFDSLKNPMNLVFPESKLFDMPVGKYTGLSSGVNKSQPYSMEAPCQMMRDIYEYPPHSAERHRLIAFYLQTFCSAFCDVIHDPLGVDAPTVVFNDAEGEMDWFVALLEKMHNRTKEEVTAGSGDTIMDLFFKSSMGKEIEALSNEVPSTKVTD